MAAKTSASSLGALGLGILRLVISFTFFCHGAQKLFGILGGHRMPLASIFGVAGVLEFVGAILLFLGLFTRPVAIVLCGEMAYAFFTAHFPHGFFPIKNGGELAVLYCFIFLMFALAGPGVPSIDVNLRGRA